MNDLRVIRDTMLRLAESYDRMAQRESMSLKQGGKYFVLSPLGRTP
jgi:hypothetical protein